MIKRKRIGCKCKLFFVRYIASINIVLIAFFFCSCGWLLGIYYSQLNSYNFETKSLIVDIFTDLSLAYIAAFVFYLMTIHVPKQKEKLSVYKFISEKVEMAISDWRVALIPMFQYAGISIDRETFEEDILKLNADSAILIQLFENIRLSDEPLVSDRQGVKNETWLDYFYSYIKLEKSRLEYAYTFVQYLDLSVIEAIEGFISCEFFQTIALLVEMRDLGTLYIDSLSDIYFRVLFVDFLTAREKLIEVFNKEIKVYLN